jgi:hypothetical protein
MTSAIALKPSLVVVYKSEKVTSNGEKTFFAISRQQEVEGKISNVTTPMSYEDVVAFLQSGIVSLRSGYMNQKAQTLLERIGAGDVPSVTTDENGRVVRENFNYSVNTAVRTYSAAYTDEKGNKFEARNGLGVGLHATYEDGSKVFIPLDTALKLHMRRWEPTNVWGDNLAKPLAEFDHVPFTDELGLPEDTGYGYSLGINWHIDAPNTATPYLVRGDFNVNRSGPEAWNLAQESGDVVLVSAIERNAQRPEDERDLSFEFNSVEEYKAQGFKVVNRFTRATDMRNLWPDFILNKAGIIVSVFTSATKSVPMAFVPLAKLGEDVFGIPCEVQPISRKAKNQTSMAPTMRTQGRVRPAVAEVVSEEAPF